MKNNQKNIENKPVKPRTKKMDGNKYIQKELRSNRITFNEAVELYDKFLLLICPDQIFDTWESKHNGEQLLLQVGPFTIKKGGDFDTNYESVLDDRNSWMVNYYYSKFNCLKELAHFAQEENLNGELKDIQDKMFNTVDDIERIGVCYIQDLDLLRANICLLNPETYKMQLRKNLVSAMCSPNPETREEAGYYLEMWEEIFTP